MSILIVDDEPDIEFLFLQRFRKEIKNGKLNMYFVHSGEKAIEYLNENPTKIVLILSDINMPGMSGFDLLKYIKSNFPEIEVIMVTAYGNEKNYDLAMEYGADDFVTKPIDFTKLKQKLIDSSELRE